MQEISRCYSEFIAVSQKFTFNLATRQFNQFTSSKSFSFTSILVHPRVRPGLKTGHA